MKTKNKERSSLDEFFRKELSGYEITPSEENRIAFLEEARKQASGKNNRGILLVILALLVLSAAVTGILLLGPLTKKSGTDFKSSMKSSLKATSGKNNPEGKVRTGIQGRAAESEPVAMRREMKEKLAESLPVAIRRNLNEKSVVSAVMLQDDVNLSPAGEMESLSEISALSSLKFFPQPGTGDLMITAVPPDTSTVKQDPEELKSEIKKDSKHYGSGQKSTVNLSAGIYYSPEYMLNCVDRDKFVNNFGLEGSLHFGPYSIRTGVGLSVSRGSNENCAQTNKYLGNYSKLDSMSFHWDDQYHLIPKYYTSKSSVYDTVVGYSYFNVEKRYTYLQVPLILGYDFLRKQRFSLGIRAGAVMSVLLKTETLTGEYDPGKDLIIRINNVTPDRVQLNWQVLAGINLSVILSRRLSLEIEPEYRYYFNSVFEQGQGTKKPWSLGGRAAFLVNF